MGYTHLSQKGTVYFKPTRQAVINGGSKSYNVTPPTSKSRPTSHTGRTRQASSWRLAAGDSSLLGVTLHPAMHRLVHRPAPLQDSAAGGR